MKEIQGKSILVRDSARFELARVRVIGIQRYYKYWDCNKNLLWYKSRHESRIVFSGTSPIRTNKGVSAPPGMEAGLHCSDSYQGYHRRAMESPIMFSNTIIFTQIFAQFRSPDDYFGIPLPLYIPSPASSLLLNPESRRLNKENPETYSGASSRVGEISIYLISTNIRLLIWVLFRVKTLSMLDKSCVHKEMSNWLSSRTEYSCLDVWSLCVVSIFPLSNAPYFVEFFKRNSKY